MAQMRLVAGTLVAGALLAACAPASGGPSSGGPSSVVTRGGEPSLTRLAGPKQAADLDVMTFNVQDAQILGVDRYTSSGRRTAVAQAVADERPDVVGTQEMPAAQAEDLRSDLARAGVRYTWYGRPRVSDTEGPGVDFNETVAVLWNPAALTDLGHGDLWFCPPDSVPAQGCIDSGPGWTAGDPRMATWVRLRHKASGTEVVVVNTHLDASSAQARERGAEVVRDAVERMFPALPVLLTADFNSGPDAAPHRVLPRPGGSTPGRPRRGPGRHGRRSTASTAAPRCPGRGSTGSTPAGDAGRRGRGEHLPQPGRRAPERPLPGAEPGPAALTPRATPARATARAVRGRRGRCVTRRALAQRLT